MYNVQYNECCAYVHTSARFRQDLPTIVSGAYVFFNGMVGFRDGRYCSVTLVNIDREKRYISQP